MPLMMLPVTSSAEFEQFFSVVFTAKCVENMSVKKYKVYSCLQLLIQLLTLFAYSNRDSLWTVL